MIIPNKNCHLFRHSSRRDLENGHHNFFLPTRLLFLDEDGILVGFSSAIPSGAKLFMLKKQSSADLLSSVQQSQNCTPSPVQQIENPSWVWFEPLTCCVFAGIKDAEKFYQSKPGLEWFLSISLLSF